MDFDRARFLAELDAQPWASRTHAYGSAEDVPDCLRALAGDDDAVAEEALSELYGSILHQGSVYEASAKAVPFLARIAAAGIRAPDVLLLIGGIAEGGAEPGARAPEESDEVACRRAVVAQLPLLLASVVDEDRAVRQSAAWAVGATGRAAADSAVPVLRDRFAVESDPLVRAELLSAMARLDPEGTAAAATEAVGPDSPPEVRMAAVLACVDIGLPWTRAHQEAALALLPLDRLVADRFGLARNEALHHITLTLLTRDTEADREAVFALLDGALRSDDPEARAEAVWAATAACELSRSAPARLAPALMAVAVDGGAGAGEVPGSLSAVAKLGPYGAPAADALAVRAADEGDAGDRALEALVAVDPVRAALLLARDPEGRPRALGAACGGPVGSSPVVPYDSELLVAVRRLLATADPDGRTLLRLAALLTAWGPDAAAALPDLLAALPAHPRLLPKVLVAVCPPDHRTEVADALRKHASAGPADDRFEAARALHHLTGDHGLLLPLLAERLAQAGGGTGNGAVEAVREVAAAAAAVGPAAASLLPALRAALQAPGTDRNIPQMDADTAVAAALHRITGDAAEAAPVLAGILSDSEPLWRRWTVIRATRAAAALGPVAAARPLVPVLTALLTDPEQVPSAVLALHAIAPGEPDIRQAAGLLLDAAEAGVAPAEAMDALVALGADALSDEHRARLTALGERDRRVVSSGLDGTIAAADERLRARIRAAVSRG